MTAAFTALSCTFPAAVQKTASGITATQPAGSSPASSKPGAGEATLPDPSAGLADLKAYHALIQVEAIGQLDGQPFERRTQIEITRASNGDFDSQTRLAGSGQSVRLVALNGAFYRWSGEQATCEGSIDPPSEDEVVEPAALMLPVGIASRVGVETVGEVSSVHYSFDQTGLARFKTGGTIAGDFWIAENGGYVVRYILKAAAPQNPPAAGLAVAQTYTYELTPGGGAPGLPEGCALVPADLPVITGAQNVARSGGLVTYQTDSTPRALFDFYSQALPGLGWKSEVSAPEGEITLPYFIQYTRDNLRLTLNLSSNEDNSLGVELALVDLSALPAAPEAAPTPAETTGPAPTADPAKSGLPTGMPLYPGATDLINTGSAVTFTTTAPWKDVAAYYNEQLTASGWSSTNEFSLPDGTSQTSEKDGAKISVTIMADGDKTRLIMTTTD